MTLPATGARASDDFDNALRKACAEGAALTDARLLDLAQAAYRSLVRTAPGRSCDGQRVEGLRSVLGLAHLVPERMHPRAEHAAQRVIVVYDEY